MKNIIIGIVVFIIVMVLSTLIFWGLGNLVIWVFKINYVWIIWHGLVAELAFILLKEIFTKKENK